MAMNEEEWKKELGEIKKDMQAIRELFDNLIKRVERNQNTIQELQEKITTVVDEEKQRKRK